MYKAIVIYKTEIILTVILGYFLISMVSILLDARNQDTLLEEFLSDSIHEEYTGLDVSVDMIDTGVIDKDLSTNVEVAATQPSNEDLLHGDTNAKLIKKIAPDAQVRMLSVMDKQGSISINDFNKALELTLESKPDILVLPLGTHTYNKETEELLNQINKKGTIIVAAVGDYGEKEIMYPAKYKSVIPICASSFDGVDIEENNGFPNECYRFPGSELYVNDDETVTGSSYASAVAGGYIALLTEKTQYTQKEIIEIFEHLSGDNYQDYLAPLGIVKTENKSFDYGPLIQIILLAYIIYLKGKKS